MTDKVDYVAAAYRIYRNYDGNKSTFGDVSLNATTSDVAKTSVYAALSESHPRCVHVIAINKTEEPVTAAGFTLVSGHAIAGVEVWAFDSESPVIKALPAPDEVDDDSFGYTLPPYSVCHFVIHLR